MNPNDRYRRMVSPALMRRSVDLSVLGIEGVAWSYPTAISVLECIVEMGGEILGGDVLLDSNCQLEITGDGWYFADNQDDNQRLAASIDYIKEYYFKNGTGYLYRPVFRKGKSIQESVGISSPAFQDAGDLPSWASRISLGWSDLRYGFSHCYLGLDDVKAFAMKLAEGSGAPPLAALKLAYEKNGVNETEELLGEVTQGDYDEQEAREVWRQICSLEKEGDDVQ